MSPALEFYLMCARAQVVSLSNRTPIYSNSLSQVPQRVHAAYYADPRESEYWRQYLRYKFRYLWLRGGIGPDRAADKFMQVADEGNRDQWAPILKLWDQQADGEGLAYMYRVSQMRAALVHAEWYNDLPEFVEWANEITEKLSERQRQAGNFASLYDDFVTGEPAADLVALHAKEAMEFQILEGLAGLSERVSASLSAERLEVPSEWLRTIVAAGPPTSAGLFPDTAARIFAELALFLLRELVRGPVREERFLRELLACLKREAMCDLADFLEVSEGGEKIGLVATSLGQLSEEILSELGEEEVYRRGEGITGSILLASEPSRLFSVGSNDIAHDPRQSPWHVSAYQSIYGALNDFWTFPVIIDGRLHGAFRVVNRADNDIGTESRRDGRIRWPTSLRRDLWMVGMAVGPLWQFAKDVALDRVFWSVSFEERGEAQRLVTAAECNWLAEPVLIDALKLLRSVVQRRVEEHVFGCLLLFAREDAVESVDRILPPDPAAPPAQGATLADISGLSLHVDSSAGLFVVSALGTVVGVRRLEVGRTRGMRALHEITETYACIAFWAHAERRSIHVHAMGRWVAEYYLAERVGRWRLRIFDESLQRTLSASDSAIQYFVAERVLRAAWELAQSGNGAVFVISDRRELESKFQFGEGTQYDGRQLPEIDQNDLLRRASQDGAVLLSPQGRFECSNAILTPKLPVRLPHTMRARLSSGAHGGRHTVACNVAALCLDATVIVVSANGGISILARASVVEWDV